MTFFTKKITLKNFEKRKERTNGQYPWFLGSLKNKGFLDQRTIGTDGTMHFPIPPHMPVL